MIYGEKIRQARELRRLTQYELAARIDRHPSAVAHMEAGLYAVNAEQAASIAFATAFPIAFFQDDRCEDFPEGSLQFRARRSKMTKRDRSEARRYGQTLFQMYLKLRERFQVPVHRLPRLDAESPERAAQITRSTLGLSPDTPIKNVTNTAEKAGVVVLGLPVALHDRDAFSAWADGCPVICLSAGLKGDRIRFSVAHEIGHLVLHSAPRGRVAVLEKEANRFAAELLLPREALNSEFADGVSFSLMARLKPRWGVSIQTLARRARDLHAISERQYYGVFEQLYRLGFSRANEPNRPPIPIEKPRALRQMVERAFGVPIDYEKLACSLYFTPNFAESIVKMHAEGTTRAVPHIGGTVLEFTPNKLT